MMILNKIIYINIKKNLDKNCIFLKVILKKILNFFINNKYFIILIVCIFSYINKIYYITFYFKFFILSYYLFFI